MRPASECSSESCVHVEELTCSVVQQVLSGAGHAASTHAYVAHLGGVLEYHRLLQHCHLHRALRRSQSQHAMAGRTDRVRAELETRILCRGCMVKYDSMCHVSALIVHMPCCKLV